MMLGAAGLLSRAPYAVLLSAGALARCPGPSTPLAPITRTEVVWNAPDVDVSGSISPDGSQLTFVDWATGNLSVRDLEGQRSDPLTTKTGWGQSGFALDSVFSPRGDRVAFAWFAESSRLELRVLDLADRRQHTLRAEVDGDLQPRAWSADGRWIASTVARTDGSGEIAVIDASSGDKRVLQTLPEWRFPSSIAFHSGDPLRLVIDVLRPDDGRHDLMVIGTDGVATPLLAGPDDDFSPVSAGASFLFASTRGGQDRVWRLDPDGRVRPVSRDLGSRVERLTCAGDGTCLVALATDTLGISIAEIDLSDGRVVSPLRRVTGVRSFAADWASDGRLAFLEHPHRYDFGPRSTSVVVQEDGRRRSSMVVRNSIRLVHPKLHWAPDGEAVCVTTRGDDGALGIDLIEVNSGENRRIASEPGAVLIDDPNWRRDGRLQYFVVEKRDTHFDTATVIVDLQTGARERYPLGRANTLAVRPDGGAWATIEADGDQGTVIRLRGPEESEARDVFRLPPPETIPRSSLAWTPDGRQLLFGRLKSRGITARVEFWLADVAGGRDPRAIGLAVETLPLRTDPRFSPDGRRIAVSAGKEAFAFYRVHTGDATSEPRDPSSVRAGLRESRTSRSRGRMSSTLP